MKIQLWVADFVPAMVPEWVDSHITIDYDIFTNRRIYIFEVNVNHIFFSKIKYPEKRARQTLKKLGFVKPSMFYSGDRSEVILNKYPPKLDDILVPFLPST